MLKARYVLSFTFLLLLFSCQTNPAQKELAQTYYNLGNAYLDLNRLGEAESAYAHAFELDADLYVAGYNLARVYIFSENYDSAVSLLQELLEKDPGNIILRENLAWAFLEMGRAGEAEQLYKALIEEDPANCGVRYNLALLSSDREDWRQVYDILIECAYLEQEDGDILYLLGKAEKNAKLGSGLKWFEEAAEEDPENLEFLLELAGSYRDSGDFTLALSVYDKAIQLSSPDNGLYFFEKAEILYTALEENEEGLIFLKNAFQAGYRDTARIADFLALMGFSPDTARFAEIRDVLRNFELLDTVLPLVEEEQVTGKPEPIGDPQSE